MKPRRLWFDLGGALLLVAAASGLRALLFADLGRGLAYLTYYPAVTLVAILGGLRAGLLATAMSALLSYVWIQQGHMSSVEWLAMSVFLLSGVTISGAMEAMRRANTRAERAREQAETANRAKDVFLANMSHELRTPLNAVLGFSRQLRDSPEATEAQVPILDIITRSGEHLLELINNVLDVAKVASGKFELEERHAELRVIAEEVRALMRGSAAAKELELYVDIAPEVPRTVAVDAPKLRQVLINLVGNAIKFTDAGSVSLRVRTSVPAEASPAAPRLCFEVADTGPGIPVADRERIFEPFVQLTARASRERGTGLGLTIAKQFVELMGGCLRIDDGAGGGSVFSVELPMNVPSEQDALRGRQHKRATGLVSGQAAYRILIADDAAENRLLLRRMLEPLGFQIHEANDGQQAVAAFDEWAPDLVLMDIRMPVMDGMEATKRIRGTSAGKDAKIVAVTAHALTEERLEILAAGCDALVPKPVEESEIIDAIVMLVGAEFTFAQSDAPPKQAPAELQLADFRKLPVALTDDLRCAAELLDADACARVVQRIDAVDSDVGARLRMAVDGSEFRQLLAALDQLGGNGETR